ncbi:putative oxidoreductase [Helianthus anomalus]
MANSQIVPHSRHQWRSLTQITGGSKTYISKNFYRTGGSKMYIPKNFYTKTTYITLLSEKFEGGPPAPSILRPWQTRTKIVINLSQQSGKLDPSMMNADGGNKLLPRLIQVSVNLDASGNCEECCVNLLNNQWDRVTDFPVINNNFGGRNNTYVYAATSSGFRRELPHFPFDSVVKFNTAENTTQTWSVGTRRFIGETIFVSKGSDEDDGYLLVVEYAVSKQMCYLVILDAKKVGETNAVVARLEVPKHLNFPLGFHGFWAPMD